MRNLAGIVLALSLLSAPLAAEIAEPHYVLYGRVAVGGNPAPTGALISL
ncbi:MAG: hypothetical protein HC897_16135, partial [Thermoanaerobaculia bacterium]|nr:hypothetical protein [Thermoanaerobaculia bacterium]